MMSLPLLLLALPLLDVSGSDPVLKELTEQGLKLPSGQVYKLPPLSMADDLDAAGQRAVLEKVFGKDPGPFLRKLVNAPFELKISPLTSDAGKHAGQRIDLAFVAHGTLDAAAKRDLFGNLIGTGQKQAGNERLLDPKALEQRGLTARSSATVRENFVHVEFELLEKVQVSGVGESAQTRGPESLLSTMRLDPRFADDKEFPNRWRPLIRGQGGALKLGEPQPYGGLGGYVKVTQLKEPAGALFVELHAVLNEPEGWFSSPALLRSKLPLAVQENVRKFRRELGR